jgi:MoCo/4Fe-4S cofactor protein with predicted Tat translocation signal
MANEIEHQLVQIRNTNGTTNPTKKGKLTLAEARARLSAESGRGYWRSLEELSGSPEFDEMLRDEFPRQTSEWLDTVSRRGFLKLMGASLALAGLSACTKQPEEAIVPYVKQPEDLIPGRPMFFATAMPFPTGAQPLLVKSNEFRPTKIEGNPQHPASNGATDVFSQASILDLYDPDRSQRITFRGETRNFGEFQTFIDDYLAKNRNKQGSGIRFLTGTVVSPTLASQLGALLKAMPQAKWYQWDGANRDSARAGLKAAFGQYVEPQYKIDAADVILSLDADFLSNAEFPGFTRYSREFISRRKLQQGVKMNRLYVVESMSTTTGHKAEHRLRLRSSEVAGFAAALLVAVGGGGNAGAQLSGEAQKFLQSLAKDLRGANGNALVIAGEYQVPGLHTLAAQLNSALGAIGKTVSYSDAIEIVPTEQLAGLKELASDMNAGKVDLLLVLGTNPVYSAPADVQFDKAMEKVATNVHLGQFHDETARFAQWHLNETHYLEAWSDARAHDGTVSIIQPLIAPLYGGVSAHEVVAAFSPQDQRVNAYDAVRAYWLQNAKGAAANFDAFWRKALHDGFVPDTAFQSRTLTARGGGVFSPAPLAANEIEVVFRPDPTVYDGRFANNGWLQETPKPVTRMCWDNAALMSVKTAADQSLNEEDVIEIQTQEGRKLALPVKVVPGMAENSIMVYIGNGRTFSGRVGTEVGFNANVLRTSNSPWITTGVKIRKTGDSYRIGFVQSHYTTDGGKKSLEGVEAIDEKDYQYNRGIIRHATLKEFEENPNFAHERHDDPKLDTTLYPNYSYDKGYSWGMAVDLNSCIGCNSCVVACVAENNSPVVGKEQVKIGRQMYWLRIDTYFQGDLENPRAHFQPMFCQHCENAPCEPVCPVGATIHSPEGLNVMVYNRCVGTRYCSNNCPYKVRRFNFLLYSDFETESLKGLRNPDVSVRSRGVMEKCTYCVQRINAVKINAEVEETRLQVDDPNAKRPIRDGEIVTACQQACPTDALVFGNINDQNSRVAKLKNQPRNYGVITDVNTRPRTSYIASVINANPELEEKKDVRESAASLKTAGASA